MNFSDIVQGESGFLVELRCNNVFHEQLFEKIKNYLNENLSVICIRNSARY